jgi:hypothetical protein
MMKGITRNDSTGNGENQNDIKGLKRKLEREFDRARGKADDDPPNGKPRNSDAEADTTAAVTEAKQAPKPDFNAETARLSEMNPLEYEHVRESEAKRLGVRVKALDGAVSKLRREKAAAEKVESRAHLRLAAPNGIPTKDRSGPRDMFMPVEVRDWPSMSLISGYPHANDIRNVKAVLDAAKVRLRYDVFTGKVVATFDGENTVVDDGICQRFWMMLQNSNLRATYAFTHDAVTALSRDITFDSAVNFFNSLPKWGSFEF